MEHLNKINDNKADNIYFLSWFFFPPFPANRFLLVWYWNLMFIGDDWKGGMFFLGECSCIGFAWPDFGCGWGATGVVSLRSHLKHTSPMSNRANASGSKMDPVPAKTEPSSDRASGIVYLRKGKTYLCNGNCSWRENM